VGFGGGEPTLYPRFVELCQHTARETQLSVTFTTHGHHIDEAMADGLRGSTHFIRVSMDGIGHTYESIRRRSFPDLLARMKLVRTIASFGVNFVVNEHTLPDLDEAVAIAADLGSCELLLLPQMATRRCSWIDDDTLEGLRRWIEAYRGSLSLCINERSAEEFRTCDPVEAEQGLRAYAHVDAAGVLKSSSYHATGVPIGTEGVLNALDKLAHNLAENHT
jgi:MoaA/NifB/PqqE/SkfB family radical SAM enzyme